MVPKNHQSSHQGGDAAKRSIKKRIAELEACEKPTPETGCRLGMAYAQLAAQGSEKCWEKAYEHLAPVEPFFANQAAWQLAMAKTNFALRMYSSAATHFESAFDLDETLFEECRGVYLQCVDLMSNPSRATYGKSFEERVAEAWRAFESREQECRQTLSEAGAAGPEARADFERRLRAFSQPLAGVLFGASIALEPHEEKPVMRFTGLVDRVMLERIARVADCAPAKVRQSWTIEIGGKPNPNARIPAMEGIAATTPDDVYVVPVRDPKTPERFTLEVFLPSFIDAGIQVAALPTFGYSLNVLIFEVLGELFALEHIKAISILDTPPEEADGAVKLSKALEALQHLGCAGTSCCADVLGSAVDYQIVNLAQSARSPIDELPPRFDILRASTVCPDLADEFFSPTHPKFDGLQFIGAAAGFFAFRQVDFKDDAAFDAFADQFIAELRREVGSRFRVTGRAYGLTRHYIDVIAWDPEKVIAAGRRVFEQQAVEWAFFQVMRPAKPVLFLKHSTMGAAHG